MKSSLGTYGRKIDASRSLVLLEEYHWYVRRCVCICKLHNLQTELTTVQSLHVLCLLHSSVHMHVTKYDYVIKSF